MFIFINAFFIGTTSGSSQDAERLQGWIRKLSIKN
jgi:hypothetical protein